MHRLSALLDDKVMRFNPYSVDDATLLACVERAVWLPWPALTQMVVFHFHDIRRVDQGHSYDATFFHVGNDPKETHLSVRSLTRRATYTANLRQVHATANGLDLTSEKMVERMQGKDFFVSHALPVRNGIRDGRPAYRMHCLKGVDSQKADLIRRAMIDAKITMLNEVLAYPFTPQYLRCSRGFIDYTTPIRAAIAAIRYFPITRNNLPHQSF